MLNVHVILKVC